MTTSRTVTITDVEFRALRAATALYEAEHESEEYPPEGYLFNLSALKSLIRKYRKAGA